jgi:3-hexulose-6-phosphate synthase/6-phospho-3-hexuloisomerase
MKLDRNDFRKPTVQLSLDLENLEEAYRMSLVGVESGVDWLEVGTPLAISEGLHSIRYLRTKFPNIPIVADLKIMDGGYLETEMAAKAGANFVVVMAASHIATVKSTVEAAHDYGIYVMGDILGRNDRVNAAKELESNGVDIVIAHLGFDERRGKNLSALDFLKDIVDSVTCPVQVVGGLSLNDLPLLPKMGAPLVVIGAPLVIDNRSFSPATEMDEMKKIISKVCNAVKTGA